MAALLSLPVLPGDSDDESTTLAKFTNKHCHISSFRVSQRDMFNSVLRVTGTRESDWNITHEDVVARWKRGVEMFQQGNSVGFAMAMYCMPGTSLTMERVISREDMD